MAKTKEDILRMVRLRPYRGEPYFTFELIYHGSDWLGYRLKQWECGKGTVLFEGRDFRCSPLHAIDSDESVAACLGFLTLRPGDTDREYFENYTPAQLELCAQHAESLALEAERRFPERSNCACLRA
ncbi:MAG: hypothetical protein ABSH28_01870 [Acidobacteriota bacterium]